MKRHLIVLIILAMALPFIQGQKGCGGSIQMPGEEGAEVQVTEPDLYVDTAADGHISAPHGPVGIMIPTEAVEPEEPPAEQLPDCGAYMPDGSSVTIRINIAMLEDLSMDPAVMQSYQPAIQDSLDKLKINMDAQTFISRVDNGCFACEMPPPSDAAPASSDYIDADSTPSPSDSTVVPAQKWGISSCVNMLGINVFKADFDLKGSFTTPIDADANGIFQPAANVFAAQISPKMIAFGSKAMVEKAKAAAANPSNLFMTQKQKFEPAAFFFSAKAYLADSILLNPLFSAFNALPQIPQYFHSVDSGKMTYAGAIAFMNPAISAAAFEGENIVMSSAVANMEYEAFVAFIQSYAQAAQNNQNITALKDEKARLVIEIRRLDRQLTEISLKLDALKKDIDKAITEGKYDTAAEHKGMAEKLFAEQELLTSQLQAARDKLAKVEESLRKSLAGGYTDHEALLQPDIGPMPAQQPAQ